ncbi:hypothetical protein [Acidovorax phage ACPWH]|nr:hypothetical protein [Acidovorax phage ACPWH]QXV72272.1 hypothetical protein Acf1_00075 [Acidovorax phage ACF1]
MTTAIFGRMTRSVLSLLGEDALLRGVSCGKVNIEHGVQITGLEGERAAARGDLVVESDVATIDKQYAPKSGDLLEFTADGGGPLAGTRWRLETMLSDNGFSRRYQVIQKP